VIESPARIRRIDGETAWVVSEAPSSCGACAGKGCGSSIFARFWHADAAEFPVTNAIGAKEGEAVVIGLPDGALLHAALSAYGVALLLLVVGAWLGHVFFGEPGAIAGGLVGLASAAILLKRQSGSSTHLRQPPVILRHGEPEPRSSCRKS
jgi:sigma-E factor negative regulatory protein RseC